jgi:hypothetical protein
MLELLLRLRPACVLSFPSDFFLTIMDERRLWCIDGRGGITGLGGVVFCGEESTLVSVSAVEG